MRIKSKSFYVAIFLTVLMSICGFMTVKAEEDEYYVPSLNNAGYYKVGQHTYSKYVTKEEQQVLDNFTPRLYVVTKDVENLKYSNFKESHQVPWDSTMSDYFVVLCADMGPDIYSQIAYRKVSLSDTTFIADNIKDNITAILRHSWPYISRETMINELLANNVLVEKEVDGKKYITSPKNETPVASVTDDELLDAISMAIYHFTDPGKVIDVYYNTIQLSANTVLKQNGYKTDDITEKKKFDYVQNDIEAIYNYLITLKETNDPIAIKDVTYEKEESDFAFYVKTNRKATANDKLNVTVSQKGEELAKFDLSSLPINSNGDYVVKLHDIKSYNYNLTVNISGEEQVVEVYAFESTQGKDKSQTMVGGNLVKRNIDSSKNIVVTYVENPNTIGSISFVIIATFIIVSGIVLIVKRPKKFN